MALQSELQEGTFENEVWVAAPVMGFASPYATATAGTPSYGDNVSHYSQTTSTGSQPKPLFASVDLTAFDTLSIFPNVGYRSPTHWVELMAYESPPLTEEELHDIGIAIKEVKSGKAKHFKKLSDAFEWLDSDSD